MFRALAQGFMVRNKKGDDLRKHMKWRMVGIAFLAQNCGTGITVAAFGPALPTFQAELGINRGTASLLLGIMLLSFGFLAPLVGVLLQRFGIRMVMIAGALLSVFGNLGLAYANSFGEVSLIYAILIGPGASCLGAVSITTLISRWFSKDRGKALGISSMPLLMLVAPPIAAHILIYEGRTHLFQAIAVIFAALIVPLLGIVEHSRPANLSVSKEPANGVSGNDKLEWADLFRNSRFLMLSLGMGIFSLSGTAFVVHAASIASEKGIDLTSASTLVSLFGTGTLLGALLFGWLCDRIGAFCALVANMTIQVLAWAALATVCTLPSFLFISAVLGICCGSQIALHGSALNELYGAAHINRLIGLGYFFNAPFLFAAGPVTGYVFDASGSYEYAIISIAITLAIGAALFFLLWDRRLPRRARVS